MQKESILFQELGYDHEVRFSTSNSILTLCGCILFEGSLMPNKHRYIKCRACLYKILESSNLFQADNLASVSCSQTCYLWVHIIGCRLGLNEFESLAICCA